MRRLAADDQVIFSDDTRVKILSCLKEDKKLENDERRATQTTGLVIEVERRQIALYASGRHAGENLDELLKGRSADLGKPIQMSDALAANWSGEQETVSLSAWRTRGGSSSRSSRCSHENAPWK